MEAKDSAKAHMILKILSEKEEEEKMGFNKLLRKMNDILYPNKTKEDKRSISKSYLDKILDQLLSDCIITKEIIKNGKNEYAKLPAMDYSLTEIGEYCYRYGYELEDYKNLYDVCQLISSLATFGIKKQKERKGTPQPGDIPNMDKSSNKIIGYNSLEITEGVSKQDILQHLTIVNEGLSSEDKKSMYEAVEKCFEILYEKKIITKKFVDDEYRYFISTGYKEFLYKCWNDLFDLIREKIEIKCKYVKTPHAAEMKWYGLQYGKEVIDSFVWDCNQIRQENKERRNEKEEEIEELNNKIKTNYDDIKNKYHGQLDGLPGFVNINLALICPKEILEVIENERDVQKNTK